MQELFLAKLEPGRFSEKTKSGLRRLSEVNSEKNCLNKKSSCGWLSWLCRVHGYRWFLRRLLAGVMTSAVGWAWSCASRAAAAKAFVGVL